MKNEGIEKKLITIIIIMVLVAVSQLGGKSILEASSEDGVTQRTDDKSHEKNINKDKVATKPIEDKSETDEVIQTEKDNITSASANAVALRTQIEEATSDITIHLEAGLYEFDLDGKPTAEVRNPLPIKVTLIGAVDAFENPLTQFKMATTVTGADAPRFIRMDNGTIDISNVQVTGTKGVNGGLSAKNIVATNSVFTNNYTKDTISGGGALRANGGTLTIEKSIFIGNSCISVSDGGAISAQFSGNVTINNSIFEQNERVGNNNQYGGAISIKQPGVEGTQISITNSRFTGNINDARGGWSRGGAISIYSSPQVSSILIDNVLFKENISRNTQTSANDGNGGAIALMTTRNSIIRNCTFIDNSAKRNGGSIYYENSNQQSLGGAVDNKIINSTFVGNNAVMGGQALAAYSSTVLVDSSTIISNTLATQGTNSTITINDSILTGVESLASPTIVYTGVNLAKTISTQPTIVASDVLVVYTGATLVKVSDYNYVAPIISHGPAYKKVNGTRLFHTSQNGVVRKTPASDIGAYEQENPIYKVTFDLKGGSLTGASAVDVEEGKEVIEPKNPTRVNYGFSGWYTDASYTNKWNFTTVVTSNMTLYAKWIPIAQPAPTQPSIAKPSAKVTKKAPVTGDATNVINYIILGVFSGLSIIVLKQKRKA